MSRRSAPEEHENHERWLVSYADFITLLFAFFVVMYALSTVNEGKYRVLSESMTAAFHTQVGSTSIVPPLMPDLPVAKETPVEKTQEQAEADAQKELKDFQRAQMRNVAKEIQQVMASLVEQGKVRVIETPQGVTIEISDSVLFPNGQALLNPDLARGMKEIAKVLLPTRFPIMIEGHTDDTPINTAQFPSNWELSAVRATTVLRLFAETGIEQKRLTAIGYADTRPIEANDSPIKRARNRRVNLLIESNAPEKGKELSINAPLKVD